MKHLELRANHPLDTHILAELFGRKEDLYLVWPYARYPFDHDQWKAVLDPANGSRSFLVHWDDVLVGHAALRVSEDAHTYHLSFLYLKSEYRSRGIGRNMMKALESFARRRLDAHRLTLVVRSYNPPAQRCYLNSGFKPYAQEGTLIRMAKDIGERRPA